jgi:putative ABC transport system permease protein
LSTDGVLAFEISLPAARYPTAVQQQRAVEEILAGIRAVEAVESAGAALAPPFSGWNFASRIDPLDAPARHASPLYQSVTGGYFETLGIALEGGRYLRDSDGASAPRAAVISRSLARELWPSSDPVGQRFRIAGGEAEPAWEVVGVVSDVLHSGLSSKPAPALYLPAEQRTSAFMTFLVKSHRDPIALASAIRTRVSNVDPDLPLQNMTTMEQRVERTTAQARFYTLALGTFAVVAAMLAMVGVYGLVAYFVGQHLHDLGIHVALGATSRHVVSLVLGTGLRPVAVGLLAGLGAALVLTRTMRELLFEVSPTDPGLLAAAAAVLLLAAFCACVLPARRAADIDPACALRAE